MSKHPLYGVTFMSGGGDSEDPPAQIPQVYVDIARLLTDALAHRYVGLPEAEQLFDVIVCGLEACDVPLADAHVIRAQLRESTGRGDQ